MRKLVILARSYCLAANQEKDMQLLGINSLCITPTYKTLNGLSCRGSVDRALRCYEAVTTISEHTPVR